MNYTNINKNSNTKLLFAVFASLVLATCVAFFAFNNANAIQEGGPEPEATAISDEVTDVDVTLSPSAGEGTFLVDGSALTTVQIKSDSTVTAKTSDTVTLYSASATTTHTIKAMPNTSSGYITESENCWTLPTTFTSPCEIKYEFKLAKSHVTFEMDGGTPQQEAIDVQYGSYPEDLDTIPYKDGYDFTGYYDADGKKYFKEDGEARSWDKTDKNVTLYAHYDALTPERTNPLQIKIGDGDKDGGVQNWKWTDSTRTLELNGINFIEDGRIELYQTEEQLFTCDCADLKVVVSGENKCVALSIENKGNVVVSGEGTVNIDCNDESAFGVCSIVSINESTDEPVFGTFTLIDATINSYCTAKEDFAVEGFLSQAPIVKSATGGINKGDNENLTWEKTDDESSSISNKQTKSTYKTSTKQEAKYVTLVGVDGPVDPTPGSDSTSTGSTGDATPYAVAGLVIALAGGVALIARKRFN